MSYLPITGTFLDEITQDIASQNWGPDEYRRYRDHLEVRNGIPA